MNTTPGNRVYLTLAQFHSPCCCSSAQAVSSSSLARPICPNPSVFSITISLSLTSIRLSITVLLAPAITNGKSRLPSTGLPYGMFKTACRIRSSAVSTAAWRGSYPSTIWCRRRRTAHSNAVVAEFAALELAQLLLSLLVLLAGLAKSSSCAARQPSSRAWTCAAAVRNPRSDSSSTRLLRWAASTFTIPSRSSRAGSTPDIGSGGLVLIPVVAAIRSARPLLLFSSWPLWAWSRGGLQREMVDMLSR